MGVTGLTLEGQESNHTGNARALRLLCHSDGGKREVIYHHLHAFASLPAYTGKFQVPTTKQERELPLAGWPTHGRDFSSPTFWCCSRVGEVAL